jgi:CHAD domain-containing protein
LELLKLPLNACFVWTSLMAIAVERGKRIFRRTERELLRLSSGQQAETVHGFRTATRRLQTLLDEIVPGRNGNQKKLLKMLNRIRKSAGQVCDIDVQLAALRSLKVPQEPRRKTQLTQGLLKLRAQHQKKLRKLLKKSEIQELRKRLKRAGKDLRMEKIPDPLGVARQILRSVRLPNGPADENALHRYRIVVKRARYAAEFAPPSAEATRFIGQLKQLQDALGHWHDWLTLTHTAEERLGDVTQSSLVAVLHNVTRSKFRQAVAAVSATQAIRPATSAVEMGHSRKSAAKNPKPAERSGAAA